MTNKDFYLRHSNCLWHRIKTILQKLNTHIEKAVIPSLLKNELVIIINYNNTKIVIIRLYK